MAMNGLLRSLVSALSPAKGAMGRAFKSGFNAVAFHSRDGGKIRAWRSAFGPTRKAPLR